MSDSLRLLQSRAVQTQKSMNIRYRACAAIIHKEKIVMVLHNHQGKEYWTLPGGKIEEGETPEEAAVREVQEETGLDVVIKEFLFDQRSYNGRIVSSCFLAKLIDPDQSVKLGYDPEEIHLDAKDRILKEVRWFPLNSVKEDVQVSQVILRLGI